MTPDAFRRDKFLRASGYNFYVWAIVNAVVTLPLFAALGGRPWPGLVALFFPLAAIAAGIVGVVLNESRVQKLCGDADPNPAVDAARIWGPVFLFGWTFTVIFVVRGPVAYVQPLWLLLVGAAYRQWGNFTVPEFRWLGLVLIVAGAYAGFAVRPGEIPPGLASPTALYVWLFFMGALWIPFGAYINWKYVHAR
jgi:hypothetical protein